MRRQPASAGATTEQHRNVLRKILQRERRGSGGSTRHVPSHTPPRAHRRHMRSLTTAYTSHSSMAPRSPECFLHGFCSTCCSSSFFVPFAHPISTYSWNQPIRPWEITPSPFFRPPEGTSPSSSPTQSPPSRSPSTASCFSFHKLLSLKTKHYYYFFFFALFG